MLNHSHIFTFMDIFSFNRTEFRAIYRLCAVILSLSKAKYRRGIEWRETHIASSKLVSIFEFIYSACRSFSVTAEFSGQ